MTQEEFESLLQLYGYSPSLVLFENLLETDRSKEKEAIETIHKLIGEEKLDPLDVVLESMINIASEYISYKELTYSRDKVLINSNIRDSAVEIILKLIDNNKRKLRNLHQMWLNMLATFQNQLYKEQKDLKIDEIIYLVSTRFRISALSAIRAIVSIGQKV